MPAITRVTVFPDQTYARKAIEQLSIVQAAQGHECSTPDEWSFLEAVTWIATRNPQVVNGLAPYLTQQVMPHLLNWEPDRRIPAEAFAAGLVADDIAWGFCSCDRRVYCRESVAEWNALSPEEKAEAAGDPNALHRLKLIRAHSHLCSCFDTAVRALCTAAASGRVAAIAGTEGQNVSRLEWLEADLDLMDGLQLGSRPVQFVRFPSASILQLWPDPAKPMMKPKTRGRPKCNIEAVEAAFWKRRAEKIPLERIKLQEWTLCVADARAGGANNLALPKTYANKLDKLYCQALEAEKL